MHTLPFRTNSTGLTDDELILLDVLFDGNGARRDFLSRNVWTLQWNLGYCHNLNESDLDTLLASLCDRGVLEQVFRNTLQCFRMTAQGFQLWSIERLPDWNRYCDDHYSGISRGRTMMTVIAVSSQVRDDFLRLWPIYPGRRRTAMIKDYGAIPLHPFGSLHVGVATYVEQRIWTPQEYRVYEDLEAKHELAIETGRSWWRSIPELQRFVGHSA